MIKCDIPDEDRLRAAQKAPRRGLVMIQNGSDSKYFCKGTIVTLYYKTLFEFFSFANLTRLNTNTTRQRKTVGLLCGILFCFVQQRQNLFRENESILKTNRQNKN